MNLSKPPSPETLAEWLEITTGKLSAAPKERLRLEIEAHYTQAVKAQQVLGLSDAEAARAALAQLGDPKIAAKCFRAQHLTESELKTFAVLKGWGESIPFLLIHYFFFFILMTVALPQHPGEYGPIRMTAVFLLLLVWPTCSFILIKRKQPIRRIWERLLTTLYMQSAAVFALMLVLSHFFWFGSADILTWLMLPMLLLTISNMVYRANRLCKAGEIWNDTPPKATAT